jgi:16S rRNA (adenine(1408)-N(1))-methyltransferase
VIVDIGTGDGGYVYRSARAHPDRFYIGVDAQASALENLSQKIYRKPAKGGLPNALFVHASVEVLPEELNGVASAVHVHFPCGSLLRAVALGEEAVLRNLRRICAPGACLKIVIALDPERDKSEISRLGLEPLSAEFIRTTLIPRYRAAGLEITDYGVLPAAGWRQIQTSWARRLGGNSERAATYMLVGAVEALPRISEHF